MKRTVLFLAVICLLFGCGAAEQGMDQALSFRNSLTNAKGCTFKATVTADYQDVYYDFTMDCRMDAAGAVAFEVVEPASICGITGSISDSEGKLTFDDKVLLFATLAEGQITPVSAPWLFINTLRSGYIKGCAQEGNAVVLHVNDSYADDAIQLSIKLLDAIPVYAEIFWQNRRVITIAVEDYCFL